MKMMNRRYGTFSVVEGDNQLVGIITLRDVLLPSIRLWRLHSRTVHSRNFFEMEEGYAEVLGKKVEEIMSSNPRL